MTDRTNGKQYLAFVLEKLKTRLCQIHLSLEEGQKEIEDMHEYYWQNYTEMDQYGYEDFDNQQALLHQINANQEQLDLLHRFRKMLDSPFFGRVDFSYEDEEEAEIFYIGIGNFAERPGEVPLIYDWRSPVSSLFYDYDSGPASYEAPMGEMSGQIRSKWQYKIRGQKMIYEFESDVKIDDEILKAELGSNGEVQLKNIVRTIQKEQNAIIRNTKDRILVIQGAAGSGKTSVALHRIAYLLYHDRKNLNSSNVLILSPNGVFSDYISHILPELGEENIQEMSFDLFAYHQLQDTAADCEDRFDQIERELSGTEENGLYQQKQSQDFIDAMEYFILRLEDDLMNFTDVKYRDFVKSKSEILDLFYNKFADIPLLSRMDAVAETFIDEIETLKNADLPEEERLPLLEKFNRMYETRDFYILYNRFLKSEGYPTLPDIPRELRCLRYEDVYPILYLKYRLQKQSDRSLIRHLVIDEMQDYSILQYRIIRQMFSCRMTILGDRAQTIGDSQQDVMTFLPKIFGRDIRRIDMKKSYRNTVEIAAYANQLTGITDMELFERHGKPVTEEAVSDLEAALKAIADEVRLDEENYETAAILLPTEADAKNAFYAIEPILLAAGFDTEHRLFHLHRDSSSFKKGLTVTTFYLAKGLEFDQVFAIFPANDRRPLLCQARYIAATRALHELYMYEADTLVSDCNAKKRPV
ncbi:MAG: AAA family ATPase [Fusicatenibacter sp.]|nr:AAA family ATPase [Lachnospiraceae bacterium]MDY2936711.1 AAA family ATPase [Fusicatenibacter sp.]